jgi:hypothetical protein
MLVETKRIFVGFRDFIVDCHHRLTGRPNLVLAIPTICGTSSTRSPLIASSIDGTWSRFSPAKREHHGPCEFRASANRIASRRAGIFSGGSTSEQKKFTFLAPNR